MIKYNFVYQITNIVNNKVYIGKHSTSKIEDGYMGSSKILKLAMLKYGEENFERRILKFFKTPEEAFAFEKKIVTPEFCSRQDTYNLVEGGGTSANTGGLCVVKHKETGIKTMIPTEVLKESIDFVSIHKGFLTIKDENSLTGYSRIERKAYDPKTMEALSCGQVTVLLNSGKTKCISLSEFDRNSKEYVHINKNKVNVRNSDGSVSRVTVEEFARRNLEGNTKGYGPYRCSESDEIIFTTTNDPRIKTGELVGMFTNRVNAKLKDGSIISVSKEEFYEKGFIGNRKGFISVKDKGGNTLTVRIDDPRYLSGDLVGVNKGIVGKRRITNGIMNKMIKLEETPPDGWWYSKPRKGEKGKP